MENMREGGRRKKRPSDSHVGLCIKTPDAFPSHDSVDSQLKITLCSFFPILLFFFLFLSLAQPQYSMEGGEDMREPAIGRGREKGREREVG